MAAEEKTAKLMPCGALVAPSGVGRPRSGLPCTPALASCGDGRWARERASRANHLYAACRRRTRAWARFSEPRVCGGCDVVAERTRSAAAPATEEPLHGDERGGAKKRQRAAQPPPAAVRARCSSLAPRAPKHTSAPEARVPHAKAAPTPGHQFCGGAPTGRSDGGALRGARRAHAGGAAQRLHRSVDDARVEAAAGGKAATRRGVPAARRRAPHSRAGASRAAIWAGLYRIDEKRFDAIGKGLARATQRERKKRGSDDAAALTRTLATWACTSRRARSEELLSSA